MGKAPETQTSCRVQHLHINRGCGQISNTTNRVAKVSLEQTTATKTSNSELSTSSTVGVHHLSALSSLSHPILGDRKMRATTTSFDYWPYGWQLHEKYTEVVISSPYPPGPNVYRVSKINRKNSITTKAVTIHSYQ